MLNFKSVNFKDQSFETYELFQKYPGQTEWIIGRSETCDLIIRNNSVSSVHGRILFSDGSYYFVDLGSLNGSFLNKKELVANVKEPLHVGDMLQLADTYLHVEELEPLSMTAIKENAENVWTEQELMIRCCRIVEETPDVKTFHFVSVPPVRFSNFLPGQFANLVVEINEQRVIRPYSISSTPTRPHSLALTVKRVPSANPDAPPGLVSNWLHDHLQVGDTLKLLGGPMGHFTFLPKLPPKLLLISAGSGITPMMSMARWAYDSFADLDIIFLHSACTPEDIPFHGELRLLDEQMPNFQLLITITRQQSGMSWSGFKGRISSPLLQFFAPDLLDRTVFVCGSTGFMRGVRDILETLDFPMAQYNEESFGDNRAFEEDKEDCTTPHEEQSRAKGATQVFSTDQPPEVTEEFDEVEEESEDPIITFTKSKKEVAGDRDSTLLEIAEEAGVGIPKACMMGLCGTCKVKAKGIVNYKATPTNLTEADKRSGFVLSCVATPDGRVQVEA